MLMCTYQPLNFIFDVAQAYTELDKQRAKEEIAIRGINNVEEYKKLSGMDTKPVFCFECVGDPVAVAAKSMMILPNRAEQFIIFEADNVVRYDDVRWNCEYGCVPITQDECNELKGEVPYCLVDRINSDRVVYRCNIADLIKNGKLSGNAKLRGSEKLMFQEKVVKYARFEYQNGIGVLKSLRLVGCRIGIRMHRLICMMFHVCLANRFLTGAIFQRSYDSAWVCLMN